MLDVRNLTKSFGGVVAVERVSLTVPKGAVVGLIGPNGAGKTSLFNLVTRLYEPDDGDVLLEGESLLRAAPYEVARRGVGRTFQTVQLFKSMTVLENVLIGAEAGTHRRAGTLAYERVHELLELLDLDDLARRPVTALPFATQKRLELARTLAREPRLLLLDEPAGGLNHAEVEALGSLILRLRDERGLTVLVVEHHMGLVMRVSDLVHVLDFGRRIASGTPEEVRSDPQVIEAYLGVEASHAAA